MCSTSNRPPKTDRSAAISRVRTRKKSRRNPPYCQYFPGVAGGRFLHSPGLVFELVEGTYCDSARSNVAARCLMQRKPLPFVLSPECHRTQGRARASRDQGEVDLQDLPGRGRVPRVRHDDSGTVWDLGRTHRSRAPPAESPGGELTVRSSPLRRVHPSASSHSSNGTACRRDRLK